MSKLLIWHYGSFRHVNMWTVWRIIYTQSKRLDRHITWLCYLYFWNSTVCIVCKLEARCFRESCEGWITNGILFYIANHPRPRSHSLLYIFHNTLPVLVSSVHQIKRSKVKCKCHARVMSPPTQPHYNNITAIIILVSGLSFISERIDVRGMEFCSLTSRITAAMSGNN